jgi:hypothetical protein
MPASLMSPIKRHSRCPSAMPAPLAFGGWKHVHAERQTITSRRSVAILNNGRRKPRTHPHAEIRGIGRRAKLPLTCCNRPPFRMLALGEEQHQNGVSCTLSMMRFCMRFAVTSPAKCYQAGATAAPDVREPESDLSNVCARIRPGALKFARFIVLAIGQRVLREDG